MDSDIGVIFVLMIFPLLMLVSVLVVWILAIYQGRELPNRAAYLRAFIVKILAIGVGVSILLGGYFSSNTPGDYGSLGSIFGLMLGVGGTIAVAGFFLFAQTRKALRLYRESDEYAASKTNSNILDDL